MSLTDAARQEAYARNSDAAWLLCISITHPTLQEPLRLVGDNKDMVRTVGGQSVTFKAFPFEFVLPGDDPDNPTKVGVTIYDGPVDGDGTTLTQILRGLRPAPQLTAECVTSKDPDTVEQGPFDMTLRERDSVEGQITAEFGYEDILDDAYPGNTISPATFPGLFA